MDGRAVVPKERSRRRRVPPIPGRRGVDAIAAVALFIVESAGPAFAVTRGAGEPGAKGGGETLLINNRTITPAGSQTKLGDLPVNAALSPDGGHLLVVDSGAGIQSLQVIATRTGQIVQAIPYLVPDSVFLGAAWSPDGSQAYVAGGGFDVLHTFSVGTEGSSLMAATSRSAP